MAEVYDDESIDDGTITVLMADDHLRRGLIGIVFQFFNLRGDDGARAVPLPA